MQNISKSAEKWPKDKDFPSHTITEGLIWKGALFRLHSKEGAYLRGGHIREGGVIEFVRYK